MSDTTNKEKARQLYESGYGSLAKVAESLGEKVNTLKSWKKRDSDSGDPWVKLGAKKKQMVATKTEKVATKEKGAKKPKKEKKDEFYINPNLTEKQRMFCAFYIQSFNATQSAIKAGYSSKTAMEQGYQTLHKPSVKKEIDRLKQMHSQELNLDASRILNRHAKIAFSNTLDFITEDGTMKPFDSVDGSLLDTVKITNKDTEFGKDKTVSVKIENRSKSLEFLTKYMGLDKKENDNKEDNKLEIVGV